MSEHSTETRLLGASHLALLPRVNLLPPEIAERVTFRRIQYGLGGGVLAALGVVALLYMSAAAGVTSAQGDLDSANTKHADLQAKTVKYNNVTGIYAQAAAAQAQLAGAMGDEVRYSQLLNDLSLTVPSNVWLKNIGYTQTPPTAAAAAAAAPALATGKPVAAAAGAAAASAAAIGTFTVTGVGFTHVDVAVWLEAIATLKAYQNPYFSTSTEALLGKRKTVNFSSTATVVGTALSGRYTRAGG